MGGTQSDEIVAEMLAQRDTLMNAPDDKGEKKDGKEEL